MILLPIQIARRYLQNLLQIWLIFRLQMETLRLVDLIKLEIQSIMLH